MRHRLNGRRADPRTVSWCLWHPGGAVGDVLRPLLFWAVTPKSSVKGLTATIRAYIDGWNDRGRPFIWTKTSEQILIKANRKNTSNAEH